VRRNEQIGEVRPFMRLVDETSQFDVNNWLDGNISEAQPNLNKS